MQTAAKSDQAQKKSLVNVSADYFENFAQKDHKMTLAQRLSAQTNKHHAAKKSHGSVRHASLLQQGNLMTLKGKFAEDDLFHEEDNEVAEIKKSIAYAEKKLGKKFNTPQKVVQEKRFAPVKYDVESLAQKEKIDETHLSGMISSNKAES